MASATKEKQLKKKEKEDQIQSRSLGNFHNLELLCKADDRQKKTLEKIIKQKPDLARSLNIYADGVKYYIARQQQRDKLLAGKDLPLMEVSEEQLQLPSLPLITNRQMARQYNKDLFPPRLLSESLEKQNRKQINPNNYTPFANRQRVAIPALNPPMKINRDRDLPKLKFNYFVGSGNNGELVKRILQKREQYWTAVPLTFQYKHFMWQQSYNGMDFNRLTQQESSFARVMYNFFEFHKNITSKTGLSQSLLQYYNNIEKTFDIIPLVFIINFKNCDWMKDIQQFTEFYQANNPLVQATMKSTLDFDFYVSNLVGTKVNYNGIKTYKMQETLTSKSQYLWLLKPADWNRGEGVHVFNTLEEVETLIKSYYYGKGNYECKEFVIQKYIERPLLLSGRKFDIRCWVLVSQEMQYFLFKEAYIRTSGTAFSLDNKDRYIHLTNNAVQKNAQNYGQFEDGNQLSLNRFQQLLDQQETTYNFRKQGWPMIKDVVKITMNSTRMNKRNRKYGMQLLGYDFMIDENLKLWLIEVNANPCLEESSNLLKMLIPRMLDDAFKLTLDQVFTPEVDFGVWQPKFKVDEYEDQENMWESLGFCS
ncbi:unnamed protein product (macronuclear) [Paramecium tetraurelia]|uniref:Tubulin-tyrosine ligase family protein n=1 Tax=Paramecium tetraurelia TaxID=5888 RepID=A0BCS9_PARTE|nr:uncharacterized protein GSPATT00004440001 [Paramecium tetraurelia]CAK56346.1 unnamed protein product [Paramecium tetraurelia]|eukprot:XP_001423744.1 hypothetical protein (macronuclear) [Paramecium tetraurelia strain d4-2]